MKRFALTLGILITFICNGFSQETSCQELMQLVKQEGRRFDSVGSYSLYNSSWLKNVEAYKVTIEYRDVIFVIAEIKENEYSYRTHKYIFCGVPDSNWRNFKSSYYMESTYGERFHKYIMDYVCNCR